MLDAFPDITILFNWSWYQYCTQVQLNGKGGGELNTLFQTLCAGVVAETAALGISSCFML